MKKSILVLAVVFVASCTDSKKARFDALGNPATVKCYSGGVPIYDGKSTGFVSSTENSDGWEFKDASTGHFIRVSGDCVVEN